MKKLLFLVYILFFFVGCNQTDDPPTGSTTDPAASTEKSKDAYASLESIFMLWANGTFNNASDFDALNFTTANNKYKEAIALDPDNKDARVGAAVTEILCTYADTAVNRVVKQWESFGNSNSNNFNPMAIKNAGLLSSTTQMVVPVNEMAKNLLKIYNVAKVDPPLISDMQKIIRNAFLPRIDYAIQQLALVENVDSYFFPVSGKMQGDADLDTVRLYSTEFMFTGAMLQGVKAMLEGFLVYKFDLPDYKQASLVAALQQNSTTFFYRATDGTTRSQNAKASVNLMIDKMLSGITKLESFSGTKADAAIKIGNDGLKQSDLDTVKKYLNKMKTSMTSAITVHLDNVGTDETPMDIQVFLGKFFDDPVLNPKASFMPAYTVTASGTEDIKFKFNDSTYESFHFPDPTFGGVFPGMTNENLKKLMEIDREFAYRIYVYAEKENEYGWNQGIPFATVKIKAGTNVYTKQTDDWGHADFFILTNNNTPYSVLINYGSGDVELNQRVDVDLIIRARNDMSHNIHIPGLPPNISYSQSQGQINLNWQNSGKFIIQRSLGAGVTPTDYEPLNYWTNYYQDFNVTTGLTYNYRLSTSTDPNFYFNNVYSYNDWEPLVPKIQTYSNMVTVIKN